LLIIGMWFTIVTWCIIIKLLTMQRAHIQYIINDE